MSSKKAPVTTVPAENTTALAPIQSYAIVQAGVQSLAETIRTNLGNDEIRPTDLDRIKLASGGVLGWVVPSLEGEQIVKELEGILVFHKPARAYWSQPVEKTGGGTPPECSSDDGIQGKGEPGGTCAGCPLNEFGTSSKEGSRGKACKEMKMGFLLRPGDMLPAAVALPPTSLQPFKKFMLRLAQKNVPYYGVIVKLGLEKVDKPVPHARLVPQVVSVLDTAARDQVKAYAQALGHVFAAVTVDVEAAAADATE